ncbi:MAG: phenylalanine--tRNA ligase subunit beta [Thermoanaerobaculia bacterium]|nr:phenylalanine--tRNA ligase subunit beta [Thermoanaerobaculia bacterium]
MKFAYSWLASYLPGPAPDPKALGDRLTAVGFIVEGIEGEGAGTVYDVEITANRPDGMNHRGLAREAAVALGRAFAEPATAPLPEGATPADARARVFVEEPALCPRYSARVIEGIRVRPASGAVAARLAAIDQAAISAPVDATNHVLWDIGQPLHAFDLDTLAKGSDGLPTIVVRRARAGETLVTLDGVARSLTPQHLVIADAEKPVALAGVMGGLATAISDRTTRVLLEGANFEPRAVRRTARSLGMHTDASHRFERGTDPEMTRDGLNRAARPILADCGGTLCRGTIDARAHEPAARAGTLRLSRLTAFLGMDIPAARALEILAALGFSPVREGDAIRVTVPSWRVDVTCEEDLIEEVIRCEGYDRLPETLPRPYAPARPRPLALVADRARDLLAGFGLIECQTYTFVAASENSPFESAAPGSPVVIENALGEPFTTMRATPVIGLLQSARHNVRRGQKDLALFEVGRSFGWNQEKISAEEKTGEGRVLERQRVGILLAGARRKHWSVETEEREDFFDGAGIAAALMRGLGLGNASFPITFKENLSSSSSSSSSSSFTFLAPGRAASILCAGRECGWVGVLEPSLAAAWDLTDPVVADLDLDSLGALVPPPVTSIEPPPRFPGSEVDITVAHEVTMSWKTLESAVRSAAPPELVSVEAKDRYRGPGVPEGFVKTTLTLRFGSPLRSLSREDVNAWRDAANRRLRALAGAKVDGMKEEA